MLTAATSPLSRPRSFAAAVRGAPSGRRGFTLIELVVVLVLVGVLAVVAIPRLADRSSFEQRGFLDQTRGAIQFARKSAVAQRRNVCVSVTATAVSLAAPACGGTALIDPATGGAFVLAAPAGVSLSPSVNLVFDALGRLASPDAQTSIAVSGIATPIVVERETGYVH